MTPFMCGCAHCNTPEDYDMTESVEDQLRKLCQRKEVLLRQRNDLRSWIAQAKPAMRRAAELFAPHVKCKDRDPPEAWAKSYRELCRLIDIKLQGKS